MSGVIAVHVGAGYHSENLIPEYKKTCKKACIAAVKKLRNGLSAVEVVAEAVSVLEDCPLTNAGIGSNLTLDSIVECDASIMDGKSLHFGSVGALSNIKNPIKVAQMVLEKQQEGLLSGGRIPPCTLVGPGAKKWALEQGFKCIDNKCLVTKNTEALHVKYLARLKKITSMTDKKDDYSLVSMSSESIKNSGLLDTVGAVCVDSCVNVASAVSSGGLLLKHAGRIGQAAVYGSGCWAENSSEYGKPNIACSTTGVGEYLIKTLLARECSQMVYNDASSISTVPNVLKKKFVENPLLKNDEKKLAGVLILKHFISENYCELAWAHNTKTMVLGYMSATSKRPIAIFSSQPDGANNLENIVGSEICIKNCI